MMFEIDENNLPFVRTRQALLVLDLQNEFVGDKSRIPVENPSGFVDRIVELVPEFRKSGNVIWVRSEFKTSRPVNEPSSESEKVITGEDLTPGLRLAEFARKSRLRSPEDSVVDRHARLARTQALAAEIAGLTSSDEKDDDQVRETFLTVAAGAQPQFVLPQSSAADLAPAAIAAYDSARDMMFQKSHYSAFKDGTLVQTLRSRFVTEIYICGALSNISVFATAMDAAQFGYAITLVDDCLGYRNKFSHDEAIRRLTEFTGCDMIASGELIKDLQQKSRVTQKPAPPPRRQRSQPSKQKERKVREPEIDSMMSKLNLKAEASSVPRPESKPDANPIRPSLASAAEPADAGHVESAESSESFCSESQEFDIPLIPSRKAGEPSEKPDRVRTKIKSRRRPSKPISKEASTNSEPAIKEKIRSTTAKTLQAASPELEKMSQGDNEDAAAAPQAATQVNSEGLKNTVSNEGSIETKSGGQLKNSKSDGSEDSSGAELDTICEGDTTIIHNLLKRDLADGIFENIRDEVRWQKMSHQGGDVPRLVAVQGVISEDGSIPIYRHPADESPPLLPFSPTVLLIRAEAEKHLGHELNHVLIQFYRDGTDYISEHSDKTLDIVPGTFIVNVSLGAQRTMIFRTKKPQSSSVSIEPVEPAQPRKATRAPLPHNSMCKVGLVTNMRWLHGIRQDKRLRVEKSDAELAYNGARISLTFRKIGTFLSADNTRIWGQGAISKSKDTANAVINGDTPEAEQMIRAFGKENHSSEFDWSAIYGTGFDVLHIDNKPKLFSSVGRMDDLRVKLALAEYGIEWGEGKLSPSFRWTGGSMESDVLVPCEDLPVRFVDNDLGKSTTTGDLAILLYLDAVYGSKNKSNADLAKQFTRTQQITTLEGKKNDLLTGNDAFTKELELWETFAEEGEYIAGNSVSIVDILLLPILVDTHDLWRKVEGLKSLEAYYARFRARQSAVRSLGALKAAEEVEEP